ncbi:peroxiredoxin family protein [Flavobacterium sp.]|jgi:thiol-disulfide isomerase/thioredoxin|uniref:peroxiredoxin family protein n=1 Tax=Flavobacterium sp. TaxID=239 RepID=UPI0037BEC4BB
MKTKNIFFIILFSFISNYLVSQENKFNIKDYKKIERKEFIEIQNKNPKINIKSILENGNPCTKKVQDSLIKNSKIQNYIQILLKDTINNELLILNRELNKEEVKNRKIEYKNKLKQEKEFRNKLEGTIINELNLEDINGFKFNLVNLKGKVIVLNFWFTQCKPCVAEFPELNELKEKYKSQPVEFFAVTFNNKETIDKFLLNHKLDFTIIPNGKLLIEKFKIPHYPYNILINKNGEVEYINDVLVVNVLKKLKNKIDESLTK